MNDEIKRDILDILNQVIEILKTEDEGDSLQIKELSNHTIHSASIYQDEDAISFAVIIYACYKILEKPGIDKSKVYTIVSNHLKNARDSLTKDDLKGYHETISKLFGEISRIDKELRTYIVDVIDKAKLKKGFKIYEHGVSLARVAEILGISQWELMSYVGKTEVIEGAKTTDVKERLSYARKLFGI